MRPADVVLCKPDIEEDCAMFVDLVFLLLLVGILAIGFFQGVIRMSLILISFYLSVVLASFWFKPLGVFFKKNFDTTIYVGQYVAFALIMLVALAAISAATLYTFRYAKIPGKLIYLDYILGMLVSLVLAGLILGISSILLWNLMVERGGCYIDFPVAKWLCGSVKKSFLLGYFSDHILAQAYNFADPILPDDVRILFEIQSQPTPKPGP
jgi:membrane protein required for colicin V production